MTIRALLPALTLCLAAAACEQNGPEIPNLAQAAAENAAVTANEADNAAQAPRSILRPEVVTEPEEEKVEPVHAAIGFGTSGLKLDDAGRGALDALLDAPAMKAGGSITLRGHSDTRGSDGDNRVASRIRAEAVRDYLVKKGVAKDRITLVALGETRPIAPNAHEDGTDDPEGRAKNRRVEIDIALPPDDSPPPVVPTLPAEAKAQKE